MLDYAVELTRRYDGLFIATFPDVPDAVAYGRDDQEALDEAAKSLQAAFVRRSKSGAPFPLPRREGSLRVQAASDNFTKPLHST